MNLPVPVTIEVYSADQLANHLGEFGDLLHACVHAGASIGFVLPYSSDDGAAFWRKKILPALREDGLLLLVAHQHGRLVGTVQLDYNTPPNQPHRAEVRKLMVHPHCRRQGIAQTLMTAIEQRARALGRSLLTLDTRTGDNGEPLYAGLGYLRAGVIPGYCRDTASDRLDGTTIMYKSL